MTQAIPKHFKNLINEIRGICYTQGQKFIERRWKIEVPSCNLYSFRSVPSFSQSVLARWRILQFNCRSQEVYLMYTVKCTVFLLFYFWGGGAGEVWGQTQIWMFMQVYDKLCYMLIFSYEWMGQDVHLDSICVCMWFSVGGSACAVWWSECVFWLLHECTVGIQTNRPLRGALSAVELRKWNYKSLESRRERKNVLIPKVWN